MNDEFSSFRDFFQTGDKWSHLPDYGDWLKMPANWPFLIFILCAGSLLLVAIEAKNGGKISIFILSLVVVQKIADIFDLR